jgi:aerobic carbon-monoxide dehydrogenase medium subunit
MITQYYRPQTMEEALALLSRPDVHPMGGGIVLNQSSPTSYSVVDLQELGLDKLHKVGEKLEIGATVKMQTMLESIHTSETLKTSLKLEAPLNLRNMGTVAGALVACDGRSPFASAMLALDAKLTLASPGPIFTTQVIGDILPLRQEHLRGQLITKIEIPLNAKLTYHSVARTPADLPIVCVALAQWPSGRTRLVVGGWNSSPTLAMDGNGISGLEQSARNAAHEASDEWASAEYRRDIAAVLARRCLEQ